METLKPLSQFFSAIEKDYRISSTHIGIYAALLIYRVGKDFINPMEVVGQEVMKIAKISSPTTYHKCIRELHEYGYIVYEPSYKKKQRSKIYFPDS
jgi:hypothetical protein